MSATMSETSATLEARITEYLELGGLFNPEMMNHEATRDLLIDCREAFSAQSTREASLRAEKEELRRERDEARAMLEECAVARDASGFLGTVPECIAHWEACSTTYEARAEAAESLLAEAGKALEPFAGSALEAFYDDNTPVDCCFEAGALRRAGSASNRIDAFKKESSAHNLEDECPICLKQMRAGDPCSIDIELGTCHAACLEGSPTVDLDTGEPIDGPIPRFPYEPLTKDSVHD